MVARADGRGFRASQGGLGRAGRRDIEQGSQPAGSTLSWWTLLRFVSPYCMPRTAFLRLNLTVSILCTLLSKGAGLLAPVMLKNAVDGLSTPLRSAEGAITDSGTISLVIRSVVGYAAVRFAVRLCGEIKDITWQQVSLSTTRLFSSSTFEHIHSLSLNYHLTRKTGEVLRVMSRGVSSLSTILNLFVFTLGPTLVELIVVCAVFSRLNSPGIAGIIFASAVLYISFSVAITQWRTKLRRALNEKDNLVNDKATDSLLNFETVKQFGTEHFEVERYTRLLKDYHESSMKTQSSLSLLNVGQTLIVTTATGLSLLIAARSAIRGHLTAGDWVMVNAYIAQLYQPLAWLGSAYRMINQAFTDMENLLALRKLVPDVQDVPAAKKLKVSRGDVVFEDVSFTYSSNSAGKLKNVSFRVSPGKKLAIVGPTGSGKSTIMRLLMRFYDVSSGRIFIDGQNIAHVQQVSLRQELGVVAQDTVLFNDTLETNLAYSEPDAPNHRILNAVASAQLMDFVKRLPDGLKTRVGERGLRLSGGEKQRVGIARMALKTPSIVLLDEATSALDTETERAIQASLNEVCRGQTTIAIAHRLSTIVDSDEIIVLVDGSVEERGTHEELLASNGRYKRMWDSQKRD